MDRNNLKPVVFVFDRVMHYHRELFSALDRELPTRGYELILLSGIEKSSTTGRVALKEKIVRNQQEFVLWEKPLGGYTLRNQQGLLAKLKTIRPAVVVTMCHSGTVSEWGIQRLKKQLGFRLIAWQCGFEYNPGKFKRFVLGRFVPAFDHHLAYHSNARTYALTHGARPDQVTVMHNTINEGLIERRSRESARSVLEKQFPNLRDKRIVLYVGAVLREKRLETVFGALDILSRQDVVFLIVGDGPHLKDLQTRFSDRPDTVFAGQVVEGVGVFFDAADVFVLPGTGGLAINEAMAHGLPVVSGYADGSADDLIVDGETGYRLQDGTAEEFSQRLGALLGDRELTAAMGEAGERRIRGELSFGRFISRVINVLTSHQQ